MTLRRPIFSGCFTIFFLIVFSCTIIQDGDITSASELNTLKWKGFEINQETNSGTSLQLVSLVFDSAKNTIDKLTGVKIVRKIKFNLPSLANRKMKLRSGTTANTSLYISYKDGNQPFNYWIQQGDSIVELYRFRYNASNVLNKVLTTINPVDGLKPTVTTNDTIYYDNPLRTITQIIRRSTNAAKAGTIVPEYASATISKITFKSTVYQGLSGNCNNSAASSDCGSYTNTGTSGNDSPQMDFRFASLGVQLNQVIVVDHRFDNNNSTCRRCGTELDTYYLHPTMILKNSFALGSNLMLIYMNDWWVPGTAVVSNSNLNKNDQVTLNFLYGH